MNKHLPDIQFSGIVTIRDRLLQHPNPIRMESGDPDFSTPDHIKEAMVKALRDNQTHYAASVGIKSLRESILRKLETKNRITNLNGPENILVTNGGMHALYIAWNTILNAGDEVIVPQPNWTASTWNILLAGGKITQIPLKAELDYRWDPDELSAGITDSTKAILINSPHNPTGGIMEKKDLLHLLTIAEKHNLYIVSDEAYEDIIYEGEHHSIAALAKEFPKNVQDKIISVYTFSKSYAMTGWRLGYLATSNMTLIENLKKMILYTINGVSTPSQYAGLAALEGPQDHVGKMRDIYRERRDLIFNGVNKTSYLKCQHPPKGTFYLYPEITDAWQGSVMDLVNHLIDDFAIGCVPGEAFHDDKKTIRFAFACSTEMIKQAINYLNA